MPPKKLNRESEQKPREDAQSKKSPVSDEKVRQEAGKAANAALGAQKKAKELNDAAAAARDPDERQKLIEEATNAQIEAESFGKTAKYLRSGAFQGAVMGAGLGVAPGATLGAITGTLVGGVSSTLLGGLGAGIGAATGALHGPWLNMGKLAGKGVKKMTSFLPQWAVSEEQKRALEKMVGQVNEQEMPGAEELEKFKNEGGAGELHEQGTQRAKAMMPDQKEASDQPSKNTSTSTQAGHGQSRKKPRKLNAKPKDNEASAAKKVHPQDTADESEEHEERPDAHDDGSTDERERSLVERETDLDRREAELEKREKALAKREQELASNLDSNTSEPASETRKHSMSVSV